MIANLLIGMVSAFVTFFNNLLPSFTVPSWFRADALGSFTTTVGDYLSGMRNVFPVDATLTVLSGVLQMLPVILGYMIFDWLWNHCPTILGCGT